MQIYYFTRTGRSKKVAEELAKKQKTTAHQIVDGKNWDGLFGYLKAGFEAVRGGRISINYQTPVKDESIVLVFPVWAGSFPPAIRTFIKEIGRERITMVATSLGSTFKDREGFAKVIDLMGADITVPDSI